MVLNQGHDRATPRRTHGDHWHGSRYGSRQARDGRLAGRSMAGHILDLAWRAHYRRLGQIDSVIEEAANRGKTNTALSAMEGQRRARAGLTSERNEAAGTSLPSAPPWPPKAALPLGRLCQPQRPKLLAAGCWLRAAGAAAWRCAAYMPMSYFEPVE